MQFFKESCIAISPLIAIALLWGFSSLFFSSLVLPSPIEVLSVFPHYYTEEFQTHLLATLFRVSVGATIAMVIGVLSGTLARVFSIHAWFESFMTMFQVLPGLVFSVIFLLLFGVGSTVPIVLIVFMVSPIVAVNTSATLAKVDMGMEKLVDFYGLGWRGRVREVYLPKLVPIMRASILISVTMAIKICLLGEFVGSDNGLGYLVNIARMYFDMNGVFFYITIILFFMFGIQLTVRLFFHLFLKKYFY